MKTIADLKQLAIAAVLAILAIGAALWIVYDAGHDAGELGERSAWQKKEGERLKLEAERERLAGEAHTKLLLEHADAMAALSRKHHETNLKVSNDYEEELAQLRRERDADRALVDLAGGLRIPAPAANCPGGAVAGTEAASIAGRDEASPGTIRLPLALENSLWALVDDADQVSAQLRSCQSWIRENGFYGPPSTPEIISAGNVPAVK